MTGKKVMTIENFRKEAIKRFGDDAREWEFICPNCKTKQRFLDFVDAGVPEDTISGFVGFSCIGRIDENKGCDWTLGGLIQIHELEIIVEDGSHHPHFDLAEKDDD